MLIYVDTWVFTLAPNCSQAGGSGKYAIRWEGALGIGCTPPFEAMKLIIQQVNH